jgi:hypothetical protein
MSSRPERGCRRSPGWSPPIRTATDRPGGPGSSRPVVHGSRDLNQLKPEVIVIGVDPRKRMQTASALDATTNRVVARCRSRRRCTATGRRCVRCLTCRMRPLQRSRHRRSWPKNRSKMSPPSLLSGNGPSAGRRWMRTISSYRVRVVGSTSSGSRHRSSNWLTVARVLGLRRSSTSCRAASEPLSASPGARTYRHHLIEVEPPARHRVEAVVDLPPQRPAGRRRDGPRRCSSWIMTLTVRITITDHEVRDQAFSQLRSGRVGLEPTTGGL